MVTISSYLYIKQDNEVPVLALELLRKLSIVSAIEWKTLYLETPCYSISYQHAQRIIAYMLLILLLTV